jgi:hypothetical protein
MFGPNYGSLLGTVKILYYETKQKINCEETIIFFYQNESQSNTQLPVFPLTGCKFVWVAVKVFTPVIMAYK